MHTSTIMRFVKSGTSLSGRDVLLMLSEDTDVITLLHQLFQHGGITETIRSVFLWACINQPEAVEKFLVGISATPSVFAGFYSEQDNVMEFVREELNYQRDKLWEAVYKPLLVRVNEKYNDAVVILHKNSIFKAFEPLVKDLCPGTLPPKLQTDSITPDTIVSTIQEIQKIQLLIASYNFTWTPISGTLDPSFTKEILDAAFAGLRYNTRAIQKRITSIIISLDTKLLAWNSPGTINYQLQFNAYFTWARGTRETTKNLFASAIQRKVLSLLTERLHTAIVQGNIDACNIQQKDLRDTRSAFTYPIMAFDVRIGDVIIVSGSQDNVLPLLRSLVPDAAVPVADTNSEEEVPNE